MLLLDPLVDRWVALQYSSSAFGFDPGRYPPNLGSSPNSIHPKNTRLDTEAMSYESLR